MKHLLLLFLLSVTTCISAQSFFEIGLGRYEADKRFSQLSIHGAMSKSVNKWLNVEANLTYNTNNPKTFTTVSDIPPSTPITIEEEYNSYQFNLLGDLYLFGLHKGQFQTHLKLGGGVYGETNEYVRANFIGVLEEVVKIDKNLAGTIGYSLSITTDEYEIERWYIGIRRLF